MQQADKGVRPLFGLGGDYHGANKKVIFIMIEI